MITRDDAFLLLKKYNKDPFHIQHALTVEAVMKWYAKELGYADEADYWGIVGLLHDIDFELYPDEHCLKAPELLKDGGVSDDIIHAVCSHGYGITVGNGTTIDVEPTREMEKVLFAADELTGLIHKSEIFDSLYVGDIVECRVVKVREDGKTDLAMRQEIPVQMIADAEMVYDIIKSYGGKLPFNDKASAELIKKEFGISRNAFKRAVGHLYKEKKIEITENSIVITSK